MAEQTAEKNVRSEGKRKRRRNLNAAQVMEKLRNAGVEDLDTVSGCVKAGIARGHIQLESAADLDKVIATAVCQEIDPWYGSGRCSRKIEATLKMVLHQDDNGEDLCSGNGGDSPVGCEGCQEGLYFVREICKGKAALCNPKYMNRCNTCPGLGKCYSEYSWKHCTDCGEHYLYSCECEENRSMKEGSESGEEDEPDDWLFGSKKPRNE